MVNVIIPHILLQTKLIQVIVLLAQVTADCPGSAAEAVLYLTLEILVLLRLPLLQPPGLFLHWPLRLAERMSYRFSQNQPNTF